MNLGGVTGSGHPNRSACWATLVKIAHRAVVRWCAGWPWGVAPNAKFDNAALVLVVSWVWSVAAAGADSKQSEVAPKK